MVDFLVDFRFFVKAGAEYEICLIQLPKKRSSSVRGLRLSLFLVSHPFPHVILQPLQLESFVELPIASGPVHASGHFSVLVPCIWFVRVHND